MDFGALAGGQTDRRISPWTDERKRQLLELWPDVSVPASEIARRLGGGLTRSAVMGRAHRLVRQGILQTRLDKMPLAPRISEKLGLSRRTYNRRKTGQPAGRKTLRVRPELSEAVNLESGIHDYALDMQRLAFAELRNSSCRWPLGEKPPFQFCGLKQSPGLPYCGNHCRIAYNYVPAEFRRRA